MDWLRMTASDLGRGIEAGEIDPVALTEAYLDAIKSHAMTPRIYARTTPERALDEARAARARTKNGTRLGLLDGVPISWKDLFDSAGTGTEAGCALLAGRVPATDAEVLATATAKGSVCLGKTHMSELAFSGLGLNPITETPPCVNDLGAVSGGSSSGAATSVAFGLAAMGIGSDTGGSVRIPAAWNDLVGLKTTEGRVSARGVVPLCQAFDTVGPLARSVEDAAQGLALLENSKPVDLSGVSATGLRIGVLKTIAQDDLRAAPAQGFELALSQATQAGAIAVDVELPELPEAMDLSGVLFTSEAYGTWRSEIEAAPDKMFPEILERFRIGATFGAADYVAAWRRLREIRTLWHARMAEFDVVALPTAAMMPPNLDRLLNDHAYYVEENLLALRNTRIGNLMGICALTLPTQVKSAGFMLFSPPMTEARLLRYGAALEPILRG